MSPFDMETGRAAVLLITLAMHDGLDAFEGAEDVTNDAELAEVVIAGVDEFCKFSYQRDIPAEVAEYIRSALASPAEDQS